MRLFIAVNLSEDSKDQLIAQVNMLQQLVKENLSWVSRDNLHITLKFLGETAPGLVPGINQAILETAKNWQQAPLSFGGIAAFPHLDDPRTIFIMIGQGIEQLTRLQQNLENKLSEIGFVSNRKPFRPHLTIARSRKNTERGKVAGQLKAITTFQLNDIKTEIKKISLMKSVLTARGAIYQEMYSANLLPLTF